MTNNSIVKADEKRLAAWGDRLDIADISKRLKAMLPNGSKLDEQQLYALAQYAQLTGLDVFTGAVYALPDGGLTDGYKTLTAWAQGKEPFTEKFFKLTPDERDTEGLNGDIVDAWYCYIIKRSQQPALLDFLRAGLDLATALQIVANRGLGVVRTADTKDRNGKIISPPRTKSWTWVAQKRALRAAIAVAYGQPTLPELAALGRLANEAGIDESEALARLAAMQNIANQIAAESATLAPDDRRARLAHNVEILRGGEIDPIELYEPAETADETDFIKDVLERIPYYNHAQHVKNALKKLDLVFDPDNTEMLFDELARYASARADEALAG